MTELPPLPPLVERALKAAQSKRSLTVLSMADMRSLCQLAVVQHDLISSIHIVCSNARRQNFAIEPASLQTAITNSLAEIIPPNESPKP